MGLKTFKKRMIAHPTKAEKAFRDRLVRARLSFKQQVIIWFYIADFVVPERLLVIEIDGPSHIGQEDYDTKREAFIRAAGFDVARIQNGDVMAVSLDFIARRSLASTAAFRSALGKANSMKGSLLSGAKPKAFDPTPRLVRTAEE